MRNVILPITENSLVGTTRYKDIRAWLKDNCHGLHIVTTIQSNKGYSLAVNFSDDKDAALFTLRWS